MLPLRRQSFSPRLQCSFGRDLVVRYEARTFLIGSKEAADALCPLEPHEPFALVFVLLSEDPEMFRILVSISILALSLAQNAAAQESATPTTSSQGVSVADVSQFGATEALDEVNARRAAKGLYPYIRDDGLTRGAANVAAFRAQRRTAGHTSNDFGGLPAGVTATASGCAAWEPSWGWGSCCTDEVGPRYAGAAWVMGSDGRRYMHLFVR
jgi:hypothetical protein